MRPALDGQRSSRRYLDKTKNKMNKLLPGIAAMATIVVASNILVQYLILDGLLTWGAFTYPLAFLVTDLMNRIYGPGEAKRVVFAGFLTGVICSLIGSQIMLQGDGNEYPAVAFRIAVASGVAFLCAQLTDIFVFNRLRNGQWWRAPLASTVVGSILDTALFFAIAFSASVTIFSGAANDEISWAWNMEPLMNVGAEYPLWVSLGIADWIVKFSVALVALIPFRILVNQILADSR